MDVYIRKTGISFKQIYKSLQKDFLKRLNIKKRKISKEIDQESTKMNILIEKFFKNLNVLALKFFL
jgi:5'(3')-deoxyribonucleotidase